jgi:hypothetical protein
MGLPRLRGFAALYVVCERGSRQGQQRPVGQVQLGMKESYLSPGCRIERVVRSGSPQTVLVVRTERRGAVPFLQAA